MRSSPMLLIVLGVLVVVVGVLLVGWGLRTQQRRPDIGGPAGPPAPRATSEASLTPPGPQSDQYESFPALYRGRTLIKVPFGQRRQTPAGVAVEFLDVVEDSRCPARVACAWTGRAVIRVRANTGEYTPEIPGMRSWALPHEVPASVAPPNVVELGSEHLVFTRLEPYPQTVDDLERFKRRKSSYRAVFVVLPPPIGEATLTSEGALQLDLRAKSGRGDLGAGRVTILPTDPRHREFQLEYLGGFFPGETKPVYPWP